MSRYGAKRDAWEEAIEDLVGAAFDLLRKAVAFPDVREKALARAEGYYRSARLIGERHQVTPSQGWMAADEWVAQRFEALAAGIRRAS